MIDTSALSRLVPGFDFLQNLMHSAGQAVPMGQWVAPTLDPAEIEKRISELKTVQFWLEQNAHMLGTTIQALEVQRMTLSTLQTMNLPMDELRQAMTLPEKPARAAPAKAPAPQEHSAEPAPEAPKPAVDPMQWWGALTQQFSDLATRAMNESSALAARTLGAAAPAAETPKPAAKAGAKAPAKTAAKAAAPGAGGGPGAPARKAARRRA